MMYGNTSVRFYGGSGNVMIMRLWILPVKNNIFFVGGGW